MDSNETPTLEVAGTLEVEVEGEEEEEEEEEVEVEEEGAATRGGGIPCGEPNV